MSDIDNLVELVKRAPKPKPGPRALNAYRHGITGHVRFFATPEDEAAYNRHCAGYAASWNPVGAFEIDLCQMIADIAWRIKTAGMMENAQQAEALAQPVVRHCEHDQADVALEYSRIWKECGKQLDLLSLYERRLQRNFNENVKLLQQIQDRRKAEQKQAPQKTPTLSRPKFDFSKSVPVGQAIVSQSPVHPSPSQSPPRS